MELIIIVIVVLVVLYFLLSRGGKKSAVKKTMSVPKEERILNENMAWLEEHWETARKERDMGELKSVAHWFFDEVTDRQLQKIEEIGLSIKRGRPTKGEASDIIGLFEPVEEEHEEILRFFKVPMKGMNQSRARYFSTKLLSVTENIEAWKKRPATLMQKEFYKFFNLKAPQGLTNEVAAKYIDEYTSRVAEEDESKLDEWEAYESIYDEINDPDYREDYEIKKISISLYRSAIEELKKEGQNLSKLSEDPDIVIKKIIQLKPEIQRG